MSVPNESQHSHRPCWYPGTAQWPLSAQGSSVVAGPGMCSRSPGAGSGCACAQLWESSCSLSDLAGSWAEQQNKVKKIFFFAFQVIFSPSSFSQCSHKSSKMWYNWNLFSLTVGKVVSVLLNLNPLADAKPTEPFPFYFKAMLLILISGVTDTGDIFGRHCLGFFDP